MMTKVIDAALFAEMIISGANNLCNNREIVDSLNVFPVPDGDTGTNMSMTFINAARSLEDGAYKTASEVAKIAAKATLRGARGNSGVILSQIFRGIEKSITEQGDIDCEQLKKCFRGACDTAYRAVMKPTEGTILTVIRAVACGAEESSGEEIAQILSDAVKSGNEALLKTQQMLPQLRRAGVVDAGGQGLMFILEGFSAALGGAPVTLNDTGFSKPAKGSAQSSIKTEDIKFAYCTEFIINKYNAAASAAKMRSAISPKGDCMIVIDEDDIVKVHIHTNHPGFVLEQAVKLGELVNIKIENMKEQHTALTGGAEESKEKKNPPADQKELGIVSVANGNGLEKTFKELGADIVVNGGQTMNPSTEDILSAISAANAKNVIVLPNNKNIVLAAQQAAQLADCTVTVIESKTVPQGIAAMMAFSPQADVSKNIDGMKNAMQNVESGSVTHAVKDTELDGKKICKGDFIGVYGSSIVSVDKDLPACALSLVESIANEDSEIITIYYGKDITEETAQSLADSVEEAFPDADICLTNGGQSVYHYIISVE